MQEFDPLVLLVSLLSVLVVFLINRWLGGYTPARLGGADQALARLKLDFPAFDAEATLVGSDGKSAVLAGGDGSVALVEVIGDRFLTRMLKPGDINALYLEPGDSPGNQAGQKRLRLQLNDFTNTAFQILLTPEANGSAWHKRLAAFHHAPRPAIAREDIAEGSKDG